jgi:chromosome transmission fidelity protein 18
MYYHDALLDKPNKAMEWLHMHDQLESFARRHGNYDLTGYMPYSIVAMHPMFAGSVQQHIDYPKVDGQCMATRKANRTLLQTFIHHWPVDKRMYGNESRVVAHMLPCLMRILSPTIRSVHTQLIKPAEKKTVERVVRLLSAYGFSFVQSKGGETFTLALDPPVEPLVKFESVNGGKVMAFSYATRQMLSRLMTQIKFAPHRAEDVPMREAPAVAVQEAVAVDFFGRPLAPPTTTTVQTPVSVWFTFNEGQTNAVRKPLRLVDFYKTFKSS